MRLDPQVLRDNGEVNDPGTDRFLRRYMAEYGAFVARVLAANAPSHIGDEDENSRR